MYKRIKSSYYWKGVRSDIEDFVKKCELCPINKLVRKSNKASMELMLDIVGPLPDAGLTSNLFKPHKFI